MRLRALLAGGTSLGDVLRKYNVDLDQLKVHTDLARFDLRRRHYHNATFGIASDELPDLKQLGLCKEPVNVIADKELGYTIETFVGYAYKAHLLGCLNSSRGYDGSKSFFFFNADHDDKYKIPAHHENDIWSFENLALDNPFKLTYQSLSHEEQDKAWNPVRTRIYPDWGLKFPPYQAFYRSEGFSRCNKKIAVVGGKHTIEWGGPPKNTFARKEDLRPILEALLAANYLVIYNRPEQPLVGDAAQAVQDPGDFDLIHDEFEGEPIIIFPELLKLANVSHLTERNNLLLTLYAAADLFVVTQGGNAVLASLFPRDMFLMHVAGHERMQWTFDVNTSADYVYSRWTHHGAGRIYISGHPRELHEQLQIYLRERQLEN